MTTFDTHAAGPTAASSSGAGALGAFVVGIGSWATTTDHKKIGRLFVVAALIVGAAAAVVGAFLGFERISATGYSILDLDSIDQLTSLYRVLLAFGVALPLMLGIAIAIVPLQIGSKAIAFGRLALFGFWMWIAGLVVMVYSIAANGGPGGGEAKMVDLFLVGTVIAAAVIGEMLGSPIGALAYEVGTEVVFDVRFGVVFGVVYGATGLSGAHRSGMRSRRAGQGRVRWPRPRHRPALPWWPSRPS